MDLSAHFTLAEMTVTLHREVDNTPPAGIVEKLTFLAASLERVRTILAAPMNVSSAYRSPALNCVVGGAMSRPSLEALLRKNQPAGIVLAVVIQRLREKLWQAADSQHMHGEACDFIAPKFGTPYQVCQRLATVPDLDFDQLIYEQTWCHISFTASRMPRRSVITVKNGATLPGIVN